MKYLKIFEEFTEFQLDEISKQEYYSILENPLVYIPESKVLEFKSKLSKEYKLGYGRASIKDTVEFFRAEYETEIDYHISSKRFSIKKKSLVDDEPCYIMSYHYEEFTSFEAPQSHIETLPNQERIFFEKKSYYRFEESDFNQMCENPQILLDYLDKKNMIKESFKIYEEFNFLEFQPEMISEQEYNRVKKSGIHLRFSTRDVARLYTNAKVFDPRIVSWTDGNSRGYIGGTFHQVIKNVELKFSTRFEIISIEKEDEPFVYFTINWGYRNSMVSWRDTLDFPPDSKLYGRMEYEEFEMVREDCKLWKDFCVNVVVEEDRKNHNILKESLFNEIPDPEIMTLDEYDDEINNGKEEKFNQKEKELFISLSDTIPLQHKPYSPEFWDSQISFSLTNGGQLVPDRPKSYGGVYLELKSTDVIRSITTYKNEDEFYYVNVWEREWRTEDHNGTKSYRCDGYECWEKFLKEIFQDYRDLINTKDNKVIKESFGGPIPDPEPMSVNEWDEEVTDAEEVSFTQREKELFIGLSDSILLKNKRNQPEIGKSHLSFQLINGDINPRLKETTPISNVHTYKNDDEFYYVGVWERDDDDKLYRCDGYECWEKFLKEIFTGYRELISNQTKTNESIFDEVPKPKSLLDENGDYIPGSSRARMNNREPFNQKEKSFINQLLETLNEEYISTNFSDNTEFALNMGEMGETTHSMRVVKLTDDYYEVQYTNYVDSDDEYIYCECDGFECLEKLLIRLFEKINKDYDYEG